MWHAATVGDRGRLARLGEAITRPLPTEKPASGRPPFYSAYVNRRLGYLLARAVAPTRVTPNQLTVACGALTIAAIALLAAAPPTWPVGVAVSLLLLVGYVFDSADGQLSRLRGTSSLLGGWLDHTLDCVKFTGIHLAVLLSFLRFSPFGRWVTLLPLAFTLVAVVSYFGMMLVDQLRSAARDDQPLRIAPVPRWRRLAVVPTDYGLLCFAFLLLGSAVAFVVAYGVLLVANLGFLCRLELQWWHEVGDLDRARKGQGPARTGHTQTIEETRRAAS